MTDHNYSTGFLITLGSHMKKTFKVYEGFISYTDSKILLILS